VHFWRRFRKNCAGFVPELRPKATKTKQKQSLEMHAAIGSCMFALIAVALNFALITQWSGGERLGKAPYSRISS
jgi:hypothetical protein